jgi:hypothetical protein
VISAACFVYFVGRVAIDAIEKSYTEMKAAGTVLKIQDQKLTSWKGQKFVVGTLKNTSPSQSYDFVSVSFHVYDSKDLELETASDTTEVVLKPGGTWRFKAEVTEPTATRVVLEEVLGSKLTPEEASQEPEEKARREELRRKLKERIQKVVDDAKARQNSP